MGWTWMALRKDWKGVVVATLLTPSGTWFGKLDKWCHSASSTSGKSHLKILGGSSHRTIHVPRCLWPWSRSPWSWTSWKLKRVQGLKLLYCPIRCHEINWTKKNIGEKSLNMCDAILGGCLSYCPISWFLFCFSKKLCSMSLRWTVRLSITGGSYLRWISLGPQTSQVLAQSLYGFGGMIHSITSRGQRWCWFQSAPFLTGEPVRKWRHGPYLHTKWNLSQWS